jgi:hypothetical protein
LQLAQQCHSDSLFSPGAALLLRWQKRSIVFGQTSCHEDYLERPVRRVSSSRVQFDTYGPWVRARCLVEDVAPDKRKPWTATATIEAPQTDTVNAPQKIMLLLLLLLLGPA